MAVAETGLQPPAWVLVFQKFWTTLQDDLAEDLDYGVKILQRVPHFGTLMPLGAVHPISIYTDREAAAVIGRNGATSWPG